MRSLFKKIVLTALMLEAKIVILKYKPKIIAITGSVGKTSTKDAIYSVVSPALYVRRSEKSFNSEIGVPLTILGCPNAWNNPFMWMQNLIDGASLIIFSAKYPSWLVLEVGADRPGDIRSLAAWLPVDIAVITMLPEVPVHVEYFDSPEQVIEEKASLIRAVRPGGTLVLFGDDERTKKLAARAKDITVLFYGLEEGATVRGEKIAPLFDADAWPQGMNAEIVVEDERATIEIRGTVGTHALLPTLAAVAVGSVFKKPLSEMISSLVKYDPPPGRMRILKGIKDTLLIDDTYNSSPAAVHAALTALAFIGPHFAAARHKRGRRIAILGDMLELGRHSVEEHRKIGAYAAKKKINMLVTIGFRARDIAQAALDNKMNESAILQYEDAEKAGQELKGLIRAGDTILIKGSQGTRMERTVELLMQNPEKAKDLLVRQDEEWKKR